MSESVLMGFAVSSSVSVIRYLSSVLRHEGAGRNVLGHHVSVVERIEHHPQHVAFEFERPENERHENERH